jgi:hypothetical protein
MWTLVFFQEGYGTHHRDEIPIPVAPVFCEGFKTKIWASGFDAAYHGQRYESADAILEPSFHQRFHQSSCYVTILQRSKTPTLAISIDSTTSYPACYGKHSGII